MSGVSITCSFQAEQTYLDFLKMAVDHWENSISESESQSVDGGRYNSSARASKTSAAKEQKKANKIVAKNIDDCTLEGKSMVDETLDNEEPLITTDQYIDLMLQCATRLHTMVQVRAEYSHDPCYSNLNWNFRCLPDKKYFNR